MYHIRIYDILSNMAIFSRVALPFQKKMLYNCLHFLLGIPILYTAVAFAKIIKNYDRNFLSPLESFEGTKFVFGVWEKLRMKKKFTN